MRKKKVVVYYENVDLPDTIVRHTIPHPIEVISARNPVWRESMPNSSYERELFLGQGNCCLFEITYEEAKKRLAAWGVDIDAKG